MYVVVERCMVYWAPNKHASGCKCLMGCERCDDCKELSINTAKKTKVKRCLAPLAKAAMCTKSCLCNSNCGWQQVT